MQYDLLVRGHTLDALGTEAFTWYDLRVMVQFLQQDHTSQLSIELHGIRWSVLEQLVAQMVDILGLANWQRAGRKHAPKPKRIPRPWEKPKATALGKDPIPISKFASWWDSKSTKKPRR